MTNRDEMDDWEADDDKSDEESWDNDDLEEPVVPCPYCGESIHEDSPQCPRCGQYISKEDSPPSRKPWWIVAGAAICLYIVYRWIVP